MSAERRRCYLENEKELKFFKNYTQRNCQMECFAKYTLKKCGCVHFSMVRTNETRVCKLKEYIDCFRQIQRFEKYKNYPDFLAEIKNMDDYKEFKKECKCWLTCESLDYKVFLKSNSDISKSVELNKTEHHVRSSLEIVFNDDHFTIYERHNNFGWRELLATCGGLIGNYLKLLPYILILFCFKHRTFHGNFFDFIH
jgi:acid-sensing ion channel, other